MLDANIFNEYIKAISILERKIDSVIEFQLITNKRVLELEKSATINNSTGDRRVCPSCNPKLTRGAGPGKIK